MICFVFYFFSLFGVSMFKQNVLLCIYKKKYRNSNYTAIDDGIVKDGNIEMELMYAVYGLIFITLIMVIMRKCVKIVCCCKVRKQTKAYDGFIDQRDNGPYDSLCHDGSSNSDYDATQTTDSTFGYFSGKDSESQISSIPDQFDHKDSDSQISVKF